MNQPQPPPPAQQQQPRPATVSYYLMGWATANAECKGLRETNALLQANIQELRNEREALKKQLADFTQEYKHVLGVHQSRTLEQNDALQHKVHRSNQDHISSLRSTLAALMMQQYTTMETLTFQSQALLPDPVKAKLAKLPSRKTPTELLKVMHDREQQFRMPSTSDPNEQNRRYQCIVAEEVSNREKQIDDILKTELPSFAPNNAEAQTKLVHLTRHVDQYQQQIDEANRLLSASITNTTDPNTVLALQQKVETAKELMHTLVKERDLVRSVLQPTPPALPAPTPTR